MNETNKPKRKVIQIAVQSDCPEDRNHIKMNGDLYALCDDGLIFVLKTGKKLTKDWQELPGIPQD